MRKFRKALVLLLSLLMALILTACAGGSKKEKADPSAQTVKIGVLVSDVTSAEALSFRNYYENYIQKQIGRAHV